MKPKGTWIAICLILLVGISSTSYIRKRTYIAADMTATEAEAIPSLEAIASGDSRAEDFLYSKKEPFTDTDHANPWRNTEETTKSPESDNSSPGSSFSLKDNTENAPASLSEEAVEKAHDFSTMGEEKPVPCQEKAAEADPSPSPFSAPGNTAVLPEILSNDGAALDSEAIPTILTRLQELDGQIARNRSRETEATAISQKTSSENEWTLWETELQRILGILRKKLDAKEQDILMQQQKEWMRSRENQSVDAAQRQLGSAMEEVNYNRSLAELTRARVYELAEIYADVLTDSE